MTGPPAPEVMRAADTWAAERGFRDILSCTATPLAAFEGGMAAARERCAQLAEQVGATSHATPGGPRMPSVITPFGALLRQGAEGGGT